MASQVTHFCVQCNQSFHCGQWPFEQHVNEFHLNWYPFQCKFCMAEFSTEKTCYDHLCTSHPNFKDAKGSIVIYWLDDRLQKESSALMEDGQRAAIDRTKPPRQSAPKPIKKVANKLSQPAAKKVKSEPVENAVILKPIVRKRSVPKAKENVKPRKSSTSVCKLCKRVCGAGAKTMRSHVWNHLRIDQFKCSKCTYTAGVGERWLVKKHIQDLCKDGQIVDRMEKMSQSADHLYKICFPVQETIEQVTETNEKVSCGEAENERKES